MTTSLIGNSLDTHLNAFRGQLFMLSGYRAREIQLNSSRFSSTQFILTSPKANSVSVFDLLRTDCKQQRGDVSVAKKATLIVFVFCLRFDRRVMRTGQHESASILNGIRHDVISSSRNMRSACWQPSLLSFVNTVKANVS